MKLLTPILGGFAVLMAVMAVAFYFINSQQSNRGTTVGFFVGVAVIFAIFALVSTYFHGQSKPTSAQAKVNTSVRKISLTIVGGVVLFIAIIYLLAWWLGKGLSF